VIKIQLRENKRERERERERERLSLALFENHKPVEVLNPPLSFSLSLSLSLSLSFFYRADAPSKCAFSGPGVSSGRLAN